MQSPSLFFPQQPFLQRLAPGVGPLGRDDPPLPPPPPQPAISPCLGELQSVAAIYIKFKQNIYSLKPLLLKADDNKF